MIKWITRWCEDRRIKKLRATEKKSDDKKRWAIIRKEFGYKMDQDWYKEHKFVTMGGVTVCFNCLLSRMSIEACNKGCDKKEL